MICNKCKKIVYVRSQINKNYYVGNCCFNVEIKKVPVKELKRIYGIKEIKKSNEK